jgi:D-arabinose 1-dehydrogenase-like Zn-dependent alcohol dehydrogenase
MTGYTFNGGWGDYVKANAAFVGHVPDGVDPLDAAPLTCAGVTTHEAVKVSGATRAAARLCQAAMVLPAGFQRPNGPRLGFRQ